MNRTQMNLQDTFLNQVRKDSIPVTIYLVSGVQLKGIVRGFDSFTIILETPGKSSQLVYKHSMASVVPARHVNLVPREDRSVESGESGDRGDRGGESGESGESAPAPEGEAQE